jgi:hypothetical protein
VLSTGSGELLTVTRRIGPRFPPAEGWWPSSLAVADAAGDTVLFVEVAGTESSARPRVSRKRAGRWLEPAVLGTFHGMEVVSLVGDLVLLRRTDDAAGVVLIDPEEGAGIELTFPFSRWTTSHDAETLLVVAVSTAEGRPQPVAYFLSLGDVRARMGA